MSARVTRSKQRIENGVEPNVRETAVHVIVEKTSKRRPRKKSEGDSVANDSVPTEKGTPPKNGRYTRNPKNEYSPSSLMNRMRISANGHDDEDIENEVKPILSNRGKIDNARKVLHIGETECLYGREKELNDLTLFLQNNLNTVTSASMYVSGQPG